MRVIYNTLIFLSHLRYILVATKTNNMKVYRKYSFSKRSLLLFLVIASLNFIFLTNLDTFIELGVYLLPDPPLVVWEKPKLGIEQKPIEVYYYNRPPHVSLNAFSRCPDRCIMTSGEYIIRNKKAIVFHGPGLGLKPPWKYPGQLWIMHAMEAPVTFGDRLKDWNRVFNWTMVHRRASDIFAPYGSFARRTSKYDTHVPPFVWTSKEKMAAWFVSNCDAQSRRQEYVRLLQRDVHVDIYGSCGNMTCPKSSSSNCLYQLHKKYRYYLAFENSLCEDYITEKAMGIYQEGIDVIPVVRGPGDRYSMFLPPNSYISTQDFSIEKLAETMESLTNSEEEFEKYFAWRQYYYAEETDLRFCDLCKKLHNAYKHEQLYESITVWLVDHPDHRNCKEPTDIDDELPD